MSRWLWIPLAAALAGGCQTYQAQPLDPDAILRSWHAQSKSLVSNADARTVTLAEAESLALLLNPSLRAARLDAQVARVTADEAGRWSDPSIGIDLERILSGADDPWVIGGVVNLTIPLWGRLAIEKSLAGAEADRAKLRVLWQERQTVAELRRAWVDWRAASSRSRVLDESIDDLSTIESSTQRLLAAGEIDPIDARLFTIALVRQRVRLLDAKRDAERYETRVRQLIGVTPVAPIQLAIDDANLPEPTGAFEPSSHPRLLTASADFTTAERALELEIRRQYPDLELGGGVGSDESDRRLLGGLSIPIPLVSANRQAIAEARARRDASRALYESELFTLIADRDAAQVQVRSAEASLDAIEKDLVPLVERQVTDARRLLAAGEFNPLVVREAITAAAEARIDLIEARRALSLARVEQLLLTESATPNPQAKP